MDNELLIKKFTILKDYYSNENDKFRSLTYSRAIQIIKNLPKITSIEQVKNIKGFGKTLTGQLQEFLNTGEIEKVKSIIGKMNKKHPFEKIFGIGPVKSKYLQNLGINTISELKAHKSILTRQQQIGLKYYYELLEKIPRIKIQVLEIIIRYVIKKELGKNYKMDIAGSYRRGEKFSGDIDIIITSKNFSLNDLVKTLEKYSIITDILSMKQTKFMGIVTCPGQSMQHYRLDIEFLPKEEYITGLLYFTGSKLTNIFMRYEAKKLGYLLNEHGLFKDGKRISVKNEKDIFSKLNLAYIKPEKR